MKKLASFLLAMCVSILCAFAGSGVSYSDPIDFDWTAGNDYPGGGTALWYKVDLSSVPDDNDVLLYLNNLSSSVTATVTAEPYVKLGTIQSLNEATTKEILPNKNYAMNLSRSTLDMLNVDIIYILLSSDEPVRFSAEPVEQGEKDLDCLNAPLFNYAGVTQSAAEAWYRVSIADVKADASKTLKITLQNKSANTAEVVAGVSFDCPSSGLTSYTYNLAGGASEEKTIDRAMIDLISSDEIYIKVQTTQSILIKAEEVAATVMPSTAVPTSAIDFQLNAEYTCTSEQWYKITVADLLQDKKLAELTLSNTSASAAHITADVAISDPYTSLISRSITLGSNQILVKELARNLLKEIENNTYVWVRLTTDASITFSARLKNRTEGDACRSAKVFDWNTGAMQNASTTLWYAISIKDAKSDTNSDKDILLSVENLGSSEASLTAAIAFACPCSSTTDVSRTIAAGATTEKRIERALYSNLETDTIFVSLSTDKNIRITASMVPSVATPNDCATPATTFDWDNGNHQTAGKTWYAVDLTPIWAMTDTVPQIVVVNEGSATATINGELSFECPGNNAATRTLTLGAGKEFVKEITRDMLESLSNPELYIGVDSDQPLYIYVNLQKENQGLSCLTGIDFDWTKGHTQKAASTVWYKIGLTQLKQTAGLSATLGIANKDGKAGNVSADIYFDCAGSPVASYSMTLAASGTKEINIEHSTVLSIKPDTIYLCLTTAQQDSVYATTFVDASITPIEACNGAIEIQYNTDIAQSAGEQWYKLSTYQLQNYTSGDATLIINNGAAENTFKAEVAFECPVTSPMTERNMTLGASSTYTNVVSREILDNIGGDTVFVRVTSTQDFTFRVNISDERGQACSAPILFDWVNGNLHPADKTLWYKVTLDTLRNNPDKDFQLNVENRANNAISASASIYFDCDEDALVSYSYDFNANELKSKIIDRTFMEQMGWPLMLIKFSSSDGDAHISANLVDALPDKRDTLTVDTVTCKGNTDFVVLRTGKTYAVISDTTFVDSVRYTYSDGMLTMQGDSIYIYNVRVQHTAPAQYPSEFMAMNITAGKAISVATAEAAIVSAINSYAGSAPNPVSGLDSLYSPVASITWQQQLTEGGAFVKLDTTTLLDTRTKSVTLRYRFETECQGGATSIALQIPTADPLRETITINDTVEAGTTYTTRNGGSVTVEADTVVADTVFNLVHDTKTLKDSVYIYNLYIYATAKDTIADTLCVGATYTPSVGEAVVIGHDTAWTAFETVGKEKWQHYYDIHVFTAPEVADLPAENMLLLPTVVCGQPIATTAATDSLKSLLLKEQENGAFTVDIADVLWEVQIDAAWQPITASTPTISSVDNVNIRYSVLTACDDSITSAVYTLAVETPTADNVSDYANMPAVSKYNGWLLMINLNEINAKGWYPSEEQVKWYRVVGNLDDAANAESDDEFLASGYYYTKGEALTGDYYAVIEMAVTELDPCGAILRTVTLTCAEVSPVASLAPSVVAPGENITIQGLNPLEEYTVSVYNLAGVLVEREVLNSAAPQTITAQSAPGYYMVKLQGAWQEQTLKYIVK